MMNKGTASRYPHGSYLRHVQRLSSLKPVKRSASERSLPGILIFSHRQQLLHMNRRAMELTGHLDQTEIGPPTDIPVASVQALRTAILTTLDQRKEANIWGSFEWEGVAFDVARNITIRGFGIADRDSHDYTRIVIVLDEIGLQGEDKSSRSRPSIPTSVPPSPSA
jgi:hypothetical protein